MLFWNMGAEKSVCNWSLETGFRPVLFAKKPLRFQVLYELNTNTNYSRIEKEIISEQYVTIVFVCNNSHLDKCSFPWFLIKRYTFTFLRQQTKYLC